MKRQSSLGIATAIRSAVAQAKLEGGDIDLAVKIAKENIDLLDQKQDEITFASKDALRKAVQQVWDQGTNML